MKKKAKLIQSKKYPEMWRISYPDNSVSDIYNLSWAKEHLRRYEENLHKKRSSIETMMPGIGPEKAVDAFK